MSATFNVAKQLGLYALFLLQHFGRWTFRTLFGKQAPSSTNVFLFYLWRLVSQIFAVLVCLRAPYFDGILGVPRWSVFHCILTCLHWVGETTGTREATGPMYFVFCRLYLSSPKPPRQCLSPTCHLSSLNQHWIGGAGLPIHMIGEVSWEPKRRRAWASRYSILFGVRDLSASHLKIR
jgi:hypothetical protein